MLQPSGEPARAIGRSRAVRGVLVLGLWLAGCLLLIDFLANSIRGATVAYHHEYVSSSRETMGGG